MFVEYKNSVGPQKKSITNPKKRSIFRFPIVHRLLVKVHENDNFGKL